MDKMGFEELRRARDLCEKLPEELFDRELRPIIEEISRRLKEINDLSKTEGLDDVCAKCGGGCCGRTILEGTVQFSDYVFMTVNSSDEELDKVGQILENPHVFTSNNEKCWFSGKDGCVITREARPIVCQWYYCFEKFPRGFVTAVDVIGDRIVELELMLRLKLNILLGSI